MDETLLASTGTTPIRKRQTLLIAGLSERVHLRKPPQAIPSQWQRFMPYVGHVPGQVGRATYGVLCNGDDAGNTEYISGVEVSDFARIPKELSRLRIPEKRYAVFTQREHISTIRRTWFTIFQQSPTRSRSQTSREGPEFERYTEEFNAKPAAADSRSGSRFGSDVPPASEYRGTESPGNF